MGKNTKRFAEFIKNRKTQPPRLLYKYVPFETARLIIANETLRFRSPLDFNDPFDGQWNILWQLATAEFNQAMIARILGDALDPERFRNDDLREWVLGHRRTHNTLSAVQKSEHVERMKEELDQGIIAPDRVSDQLRRLRVFCLARIPDSIQMWSYYATGHEGVVLAFDTAVLEEAWEVPVEEVQYAESLPEIVAPETFFDYFIYGEEMPAVDHQLAANALTLTKAHTWSDEKEWRYVFIADRGDTTRHVDMRCPVSALAGLASGCKCKPNDFKILCAEAIAKNPRAEIWATTPHATRFDLVAVRLEAPH